MIQGKFLDIRNKLYTVTFHTDKADLVIGEKNDTDEERVEIYFTDNPVVITTQNAEITNIIVKKQCTISLLSAIYLGDYIFSFNDREIRVTVTDDDDNLYFDGFVTNDSYNQNFANSKDEFEINCVDYLSTLENHTYKEELLTDENSYSSLKENAKNVSFKEILDYVLGENTWLFDNSVGLSKGRENTVFDDIYISELLILGDSEDDIWDNETLLIQMLQFLNLHIRWDNGKYKIYNLATLKKNADEMTISSGCLMSDDTQLTIDNVYNQIQINCDVNSVDEVISNPLDDESLYSPYPNRVQVANEYYLKSPSNPNDGKEYSDMFDGMINFATPPDADEKDWFSNRYLRQWFLSKTWKLNTDNMHTVIDGEYVNPDTIAKVIRTENCRCAIMQEGSYKYINPVTDNTIVGNVPMTKYMVFGVNGNGDNVNPVPTDGQLEILQAFPMAEYSAKVANSYIPPASTKYYLVFGGKLMYKPRIIESEKNKDFYDGSKTIKIWSDVPIKGEFDWGSHGGEWTDEERGMYAIMNYMGFNNSNTMVPDTVRSHNANYMQPVNSKDLTRYTYAPYSKTPNAKWMVDVIHKVNVLCCELKIGDKWCVEVGEHEYKWFKQNELPLVDDDGNLHYPNDNKPASGFLVPHKYMYLGFDPKIGDNLLNVEYPLSNNITWNMNLGDVEGMAIPITAEDKLNGQLSFKIISPVNVTWSTTVRTHPSFWRHTKWAENQISLLAQTEYITMQDFSCKLYSDQGGFNNIEEQDLVYISNDQHIKGTDNIFESDWKIHSALTDEEARKKGVPSGLKLSTAFDKTGEGITKIYSSVSDTTAKAEELYINDYYNQITKPRIKHTSSLKFEMIDNDFNKLYNFNYFPNRIFQPLESETDLKYSINNITLLEINS